MSLKRKEKVKREPSKVEKIATRVIGITLLVLLVGGVIWMFVQSYLVKQSLKKGMEDRLFNNGGTPISEIHEKFESIIAEDSEISAGDIGIISKIHEDYEKFMEENAE